MQLLDCVLNERLDKPFGNPPPRMALKKRSGSRADSRCEEEGDNDYSLPSLSKTKVQSALSIKFKNLRLEVDTQRMIQQLNSTNYDNSEMIENPEGQANVLPQLGPDKEAYEDILLASHQMPL